MKKYKNLFLIISLVLCLLVTMLCFAGCKGSGDETPDNSSDALVSDSQNGENTNSTNVDADENQSDSTNGNSSKIGQNATGSNIGGTTNNTDNSSKIELGQDVVIDFGDSEEDNDIVTNNSSNNSSNNTSNNNNNNANANSSGKNNDGWTGDYIIPKK